MKTANALKNCQDLDDALYPSSDGEPMGDTSIHMDAAGDWYEVLKAFYAKLMDVLVLANVLLYYERGNPSARKAPDVMVIKGVRKGPRRVFKIWEEGAVPCVAFEFTSESTWTDDLQDKKELYARLGIREYFIYDPELEHLEYPLIGFRLAQDGQYAAIPRDAAGSLLSEELGLRLQPDGHLLRGIDIATSRPLPHLWEVYAEVARLQGLLEQQEKPID
jgi:hypothetical protein